MKTEYASAPLKRQDIVDKLDLREAIFKTLDSYGQDRSDNLDLAEHIATELADAFGPTLADAERYRWMKTRDLDAIDKGGVFAGLIPQNLIVNGDDLDKAIDAEMQSVRRTDK